MTQAQLERRVRYLTMYAVGSTLLFLVMTVAAFSPQRVGESEATRADNTQTDTLRAGHVIAERLDIVEPDGRRDLVIANTERLPGAVVEGEELIDHREGIAGMIFYNAEETEMGGLTFAGGQEQRGYETFGHLSFDKYNQDQVVALNHKETDSSQATGLSVWDRPQNLTIKEVINAVQTQRSGTQDSTRLDQAQRTIERNRKDTAFRMFAGTRDKNAGIHLYDTEGRERIRMVVDSLDRPQLVFLDEDGEVMRRFSSDN